MALAVVVVLLVIGAAYSTATNPNFDWQIVGQFVFSPNILRGLGSTLLITITSMVVAVIVSIIIAVMRMSPSRIVSSVAAAYVFVFRGIPLIVLLILVGNIGLFVKTIVIGIPFTDIVFVDMPAARLITPFVASVIGLSLAGAAYMAEIMRSGLLAIGRGQREAAKALGLNGARTLRYIVLPQALRVIVPPMGNEFIGMLKASAIVSVIAGGDLLTVAQGIAGTNYRTIELLIVASIWYLIVIVIFSIGQHFLERRTAER
jgi:polar amino acid transport system permease protein